MFIIFGMSTWYTFIIQQIDHPNTAIESGIYLSLTRTMWPIGIALLILTCVRGYGGPVNNFLSSTMWLPLCRLSYAIYIVHMPILLVIAASLRRPLYFSKQTIVRIIFNEIQSAQRPIQTRKFICFFQLLGFFSNMVVSFIVCLIGALICESPILKIEKFIFGGGRPVKRTESPANTSAISQQDLLRRAEWLERLTASINIIIIFSFYTFHSQIKLQLYHFLYAIFVLWCSYLYP